VTEAFSPAEIVIALGTSRSSISHLVDELRDELERLAC
jgi:biotin operon repressor